MRISLSAVVLSALVLQAQDQPYSTEKETALGAVLARDVRNGTALLDSAAALEYVQQVGARLRAQLPATKFPYTFALTAESPTPAPLEPISLPGGYIFLQAGLVLAAQDESEFAGVLAHAMAHVAARRQVGQLPSIPLISWGGPNGLGASQNANTVLPSAFIPLQTGYESEADRLAVEMTSGAGYDPAGLARYISRVQFGAARLQAIRQAIQALPQPGPAAETAGVNEFARIQQEIRRLVPPAK